MKKILITGANSYIGTSFENYLKQCGDYQIDVLDMVDGSWKMKSFSEYDVICHVAGIAHQKETKENAHLYYEINRDLAIETAKKAKSDCENCGGGGTVCLFELYECLWHGSRKHH